MATVKLAGVCKRYENGGNSVDAVEDLDLVVADGDFVVLLGPSGCGKTTILRMIAGLESVTAGTILINDECVNAIPPKNRDVAMVFQDFALYPHMTVAKNLAFALSARQVAKPEIEKQIAAVAELLGIEELLQRYPQELSGGQQQRVAVGRAMVRQPGVFLFDEPLSNLDTALRFRMRSELKRLHSQLRTTTIHVTHDQEEAMVLGDKIVVLNLGKIQQYGAPLEIFHQPVNRFVAEFIGSPTMNFVDGKIGQLDNRLEFVGDDVECGVTLPPGRFDFLSRYQDHPVVMGVRPDDLVAGETPACSDSLAGWHPFVTAKVETVESPGASTDLRLRTDDGTLLTSRVLFNRNGPQLQSGDCVELRLNLDAIHFFERGPFGRRL